MTAHVHFRPTFARVSLGAILSNYAHLKSLAGGALVCPVVKADAYGHGAVRISQALESDGGCALFAVGNLDEALELRAGGIASEILVLFGSSDFAHSGLMADNAFTPVVSSLETLKGFAQTLSASRQPLGVHLEFDTGMARLGLDVGQAREAAKIIKNCPSMELRGVCTHFAKAGESDGFTALQLGRLKDILAVLREEGLSTGIVHAANSAALMSEPESIFNCVRTGIALYGIRPESWLDPEGKLTPALEWVSRIVQVREVAKGVPISYGGTFVTQRPSRIGAVPVGYADGYRRSLGNRAEVLAGGKRVPVVGRVCMDIIMLDLTDAPEAVEGGEVVLLGSRGGESIPAEELAALQSTIPYEILCAISRRVVRHYT